MARVLVADDDRSVRDLITATIEMDAHEVEAVGTESEAVLLYRGFAPDVMVLDVSMPQGGAEAILERIDATEPGVTCPVLVVTGDAASAVQHDRIVQVLQKPFAIDTLRQAVSSALSRP